MIPNGLLQGNAAAANGNLGIGIGCGGFDGGGDGMLGLQVGQYQIPRLGGLQSPGQMYGGQQFKGVGAGVQGCLLVIRD